jgi:hypothetical protein
MPQVGHFQISIIIHYLQAKYLQNKQPLLQVRRVCEALQFLLTNAFSMRFKSCVPDNLRFPFLGLCLALEVNRDHAAGLAIAVQKWFLRPLFPTLFGNYSLFVEGMIAHFTEKIYIFKTS